MKGASEYVRYFETGQHGRLYIVCGYHARGSTFRIFVLPKGEAAIPNGDSNPPLNKDAVEVYGITGGQPGWTETYGWLHKGKWQENFNRLLTERKRAYDDRETRMAEKQKEAEQAGRKRTEQLLSEY